MQTGQPNNQPFNMDDPVFFKHKDYIQDEHERLNNFDVCIAASRIVGQQNIEGAQMIGGIWMIYTKNLHSRAQLVTKGSIQINGRSVHLFDKNPSMNKMRDEYEKIVIKDLPLFIPNFEIEHYLRSKNIELTSDVKYSMARNSNGDITEFKNGDRFAFAKAPILPLLPRINYIAEYKFKVFHDSQFKPNCRTCNVLGHTDGSETCPCRNTGDPIIPFKSQDNVLSMFYGCEVPVFNETFDSGEHAYQWKQAIEANMPNLAERIKHAPHAGKAKKLSKEIPQLFRQEWEKQNIHVMKEVNLAKAKNVPEFAQTLIDSEGSYLAEATFDRFWASGLTPEITGKIDPQYYPGENTLGQILMNLRTMLINNKNTGFIIQENNSDIDENSDSETELNQNTEEADPDVTQTPASTQPAKTQDGTETNSASGVKKANQTIINNTKENTKTDPSLYSKVVSAKLPATRKTITSVSKPRSGSASTTSVNIKEIFSRQKEDKKRKQSKTPEKQKDHKLKKSA